jgi:hypothetical protein
MQGAQVDIEGHLVSDNVALVSGRAQGTLESISFTFDRLQ